MPSVKPAVEAFARIKVVGCGGSGGNVLDHMIRSKVQGVDFIAVNTDAQDLHHNLAPKKIHVGKNLTRGLGAGMNPELGRQAAEETIEEIKDALKGADMVFVACGMGGGTGTGVAPVVADAARSQGALAVGVVTKPFSFEGAQRMRIADEGLQRLRESVDAVVVIPNDRLLSVVEKGTTFRDAFGVCDEVLRQAVQGISDLITMPGIVNVDFADVKAIMQGAGSALMGIGRGSGENRAVDAAKEAINSPLLDVAIDGAKGVLFAIHGGSDMSMWEVQEAARVITESVDKDAKIIFGAIEDDKLKKGELKITVIASGFPENVRSTSGAPLFFADKEAAVNVFEKKKATPEVPSTFPKPIAMPVSTQQINIKQEEQESDLGWDDTIPAFLRRKK
ncbi:MAG: cell division protein FtsZ [Candidatus Ryanbacteria bacterium RIFCSPHIGHO2_02_FULL_48_12]|uniref:Cell division protein FtsZ n=1 Tax=Candidatus Ryanbacteria bacterium RIFCSPHIGHO2_01_FULL_48_27 TaxID=1802115 RepID=A0A1G2G5L6_9BACT|nr:MAG: cell division protein FtsZ [Candidatus Ryanbacteria bacterium RIFCSPHIGHO2_01_FULL_48_27]OGZ48546.1 MAG: cell division protein FtsZ [Candidatus Ryanbacteria bacterium RIFCSPHIGHO2_02_FULL_48_12]